ncbi:unnamed protein product [Lota lota]
MEWRYVGAEDRDRLKKCSEDGEFWNRKHSWPLLEAARTQTLMQQTVRSSWMSFSDFLCQYSTLEICNFTPDALTDKELKKWAPSEFEEGWRRGSTGCRNFSGTVLHNDITVIPFSFNDVYFADAFIQSDLQ